MKFGASVWPFKWNTPYDVAISRIARLGFGAVELIAWNREVLEEYYTPRTVKDLGNIIDSEGLVLSQFVSTPSGMASPDKREREQSVEHFKKLVEVGVALGTDIVNSVSVHPFGIQFPRITELPHLQSFQVDIPIGLNWQQNWLDYVDTMRRCCDLCEDAGLKYALEPHPFRYVANASAMLRLIDYVKSDSLGMNFDPSHLFPVGEIPHVVIYQLGDRIFHCHFSDNDATTNVHWRPGKGKIDWEAVMIALKAVGYDGVISIELEDVPGVARSVSDLPSEWVAAEAFDRENTEALNYIRDMGKRVGYLET